MPNPIIDPLSKTEDALIALFNLDSTLATYNWQRWESDANLAQPRGYINVATTSEIVEPRAPITLRCEVVLEGKPKHGSQAEVIAIALAMLGDPTLHIKLNGIVNDASLKYYGPAERIAVAQSIEGDLRVRRIVFELAALWSVEYQYV